MTTNVPVGSVIRYYYRRAWEYARIVELSPEIAAAHREKCKTCTEEIIIAIQIIGLEDSCVPVGTRIFQGVWVGHKRSHFEVRRTYVTKTKASP